MQFSEFQRQVSALSYGKRLPSAVYLFRNIDSDFGPALNQIIAILETRHQIGPEFNLLIFRTDEFKVSFLSYPWTIIRMTRRVDYLTALEAASVDQNIVPFATFIREEMLIDWSKEPPRS